jgi:hypothetical protein
LDGGTGTAGKAGAGAGASATITGLVINAGGGQDAQLVVEAERFDHQAGDFGELADAEDVFHFFLGRFEDSGLLMWAGYGLQ